MSIAPEYTLEPRQDEVVSHFLKAELQALRRERGPIVRARFPFGGDGWIAIGYDEARMVFEDNRFSVQRHRGNDFPRMRLNEGQKPPFPASFVQLDGPEHIARRRVLTKHLSVKRVMQLKPHTETTVTRYLDDLEAQGQGVDIVENFTQLLPLTVVCDLLGAPIEERHSFLTPALDLMNGRLGSVSEASSAIEQVNTYFADLVQRKRAEAGPDLLSALIHDTEVAGLWEDQELYGMGFVLLTAGHDATAAILGGIIYWLAHSPDLADHLRSSGSLARAIEEFLRVLPAGTGTRTRIALEDIHIGGVTVARDEAVLPLVHPANFDEKIFDDPQAVNPERIGPPHLRFGHGAHACLGNQLARMEIEVAIRQVLERFPALGVVEPSPDWREKMLMRGPKSLKVTW